MAAVYSTDTQTLALSMEAGFLMVAGLLTVSIKALLLDTSTRAAFPALQGFTLSPKLPFNAPFPPIRLL
jgi:hypothetical protein